MPVKVPYQFVEGLDGRPREQLWRNFGEIQAAIDALETGTTPAGAVAAEDVAAGTFGAGSFAFPASLTVAGTLNTDGDLIQFPSTVGDNKINLWSTTYSLGIRSATFLLRSGGEYHFESGGSQVLRITSTGRTYFRDGLELAHPSSTPYIDFHRSTDPAEATDYNMRIINASTGWLMVYGGQFQVVGGWLRNTGNFGWYNDTHGGGWYMIDSTWIRSYGGKSVFCEAEIGAGAARIRNWGSATYATFGHYQSLGNGGHPYGHMMSSAGECWIGANNYIRFYVDGAHLWQIDNVSGANDTRMFSAAVIAGATMVRNATSGQIGPNSSSKRFKIERGPLEKALDLGLGEPAEEHANPVFRFRPLRFHWNEKVASHDIENPKYPTGIAGFFSEEVAEEAPDAVHYDEDDLPIDLNQNAMMAYIVGGLQHTHAGGHRRNKRLNALEPRVDDVEDRLARIEALPGIANALKGE